MIIGIALILCGAALLIAGSPDYIIALITGGTMLLFGLAGRWAVYMHS